MRFEDVLLGLIARRPASGYDLGNWLARDGIFIRANADQSQIYKSLGRLALHGDADFVIEKRDGAPDAKVYAPTQAGIERLYRLAESEYVPQGRWQEPDFTIRYGLLGPLRPDLVPALIETELNFRRAQVARFRNRPRRLIFDDDTPDATRDIATLLFQDMHIANSGTLDTWLEHLEALRERWNSRPHLAR